MTDSPVSIGIAIVEHDDCFLIGTRLPDQVLAGLAEFPGGKCRPQEPPADCAVRECYEETGVRVVPLRLLDRVVHSYAHGTVELQFWRCRPETTDTGALLPAGTFEWIPRSRLRRLSFPEANAIVVQLLASEPDQHP